MINEPVAWLRYKNGYWSIDFPMAKYYTNQGNPNIPLYTHPVKYCPSENNEAYEKGFIDGMAKQRDSAVQQMVEANSHPVKELDCYGDGNVYCGVRSKDSEIQTIHFNSVKELTDDEITAISKEIFKDYKNFHHYQIDFARAILRKASEK